ncbi:MAG: LysM peptidoglycan-binding domain-containing protein, partial [Anaerolineales bacterium]
MAIKQLRFPRVKGFALAVLAGLLAAPSLACSRETSSAVDPESLFATPTATLPPPTETATSTTIVNHTATITPQPTSTLEPTSTYPPTPTLRPRATPLPEVYYVQAGDTLQTIAIRFGVLPSDIRAVSNTPLPESGLIEPQQQLIIPVSLEDTSESIHLFPDSAIVYSPTFANFDPVEYIHQQGGYLASYISGGGDIANGAEILHQIAFNNSFSPKLLLALLEHSSGWVTEKSPPAETRSYPLGYRDPNSMGLTAQLIWATNILSIGYYGWRDASLLELTFGDDQTLR